MLSADSTTFVALTSATLGWNDPSVVQGPSERRCLMVKSPCKATSTRGSFEGCMAGYSRKAQRDTPSGIVSKPCNTSKGVSSGVSRQPAKLCQTLVKFPSGCPG